MKVLGGKAKGRKIATVRGRKTRPTLQSVKKSIFDTLGTEVVGAKVLDLFAGTGSLGVEALSRGSKEVTFVEVNRRVLDKLRENLSLLGFDKQSKLVNQDALRVVRRLWKEGIKYKIVFADPPYGNNLIFNIIEIFRVCDIFESGAFLVIEHSKKIDLPHQIGHLTLSNTKKFGETCVSLYRKEKEQL